MVILFILVGGIVGALAASFAVWSGATLLFALLCYSVFGSLSALAVIFALYMRDIAEDGTVDWNDNQDSKRPASA